MLPVTFPATHIKLCVQCRITSTYVYSPTRVFRSVPLLLFAGFLILGLKMSDRLKVRSVFFLLYFELYTFTAERRDFEQ